MYSETNARHGLEAPRYGARTGSVTLRFIEIVNQGTNAFPLVYLHLCKYFLMKKLSFVITLLLFSVNVFSQTTINQEFDEMLELLLSNSVAQITVDELEEMDGVCLLDAQ